MRIGIDARMIGINHGGIGRYVLELVKNLLIIDTQNQYVLFTNYDAENEVRALSEKFLNVKIVLANIRHYSFAEQALLPKILNRQNLDLMHFPNFNVPLLYNRPFVVTIHDMVHHKISGAKPSKFLHFLAYKKIIENSAKKAKKIITVSHVSARDIEKYLKVPSQKILVIYEGPSNLPEVKESFVAETKNRYLLNDPYFLFVGVMERKKNIPMLCKGFDEFLNTYKLKMNLVISGRVDSHYPKIQEQALKVKNNGQIIFTGFVSDRVLSALYKGAHAFVSASLHEGFGLPGVEAMRQSLPLAVSNLDVFNEIYDNAAVYFNPLQSADIAEKFYLLARDSAFYTQMQEKSFDRGQFFSWEKTAQETLKLYLNVLK